MKCKTIVVIFMLSGFFSLVLGAETAELKTRFLQRKPLLDEMKSKGLIGENNLGFLVFRTVAAQPEESDLIVKAENADRQTIYAEIATRLNISPAEVGSRRAVQIAQQAAVGHWLQDADGKWYRKA